MGLPPFNYLAPKSSAELVGMLAEHGDRAKVLAGGTDLINWIAEKIVTPEVVIDLNASLATAYINGVATTSQAFSSYGHQNTVTLGSASSAGGYNLIGQMDQVRFFNRALTQAEVAQLSTEL